MPTIIIKTETVEQMDAIVDVIMEAEDESLDFAFNVQTDPSEAHHD